MKVAAESLDAKQAVAFVLAALRLFHAEGDRHNRAKARLRHVRERLGDATFLERLEREFQQELLRNPGVTAPDLPAVAKAPAGRTRPTGSTARFDPPDRRIEAAVGRKTVLPVASSARHNTTCPPDHTP